MYLKKVDPTMALDFAASKAKRKRARIALLIKR